MATMSRGRCCSGTPLPPMSAVSRGPAHDVDDQVGRIVLAPRIKNKAPASIDNAFACAIIERIEVQQQQFVVKLKPHPDDDAEEHKSTSSFPGSSRYRNGHGPSCVRPPPSSHCGR